MAKSIGIDLGTTNSVMCFMHTEPEIIMNRENDRLTPSCVAYRRSKKTGDSIIVGKIACDYAKVAEKDFLHSVKRLMGQSYNDDNVHEMAKRVNYIIEPSPDGEEDVVRIKLGGDYYTPKQISAMILRKLKEDAEFRLGDTVDSAVITVPAYFSERQKHATREAGRLAGLKVKKIIDEPTAAAIAYGIDQKEEDKMVLVFDLGGGTFDVSIMLMVGGIFSQMDNEGDMWLGGEDFDRIIMDKVIHQVETEEEIDNLTDNKEFMHVLAKKAREAKEILSSQDSAEIIITDVLKDEMGLPIPVEFEISRSEFERAIQPYADKTLELVKKALEQAGLEKDDVDEVLMVGGSSTIPKFQQAIENFFGKEKVQRNIDPMTCVAQGAAILAKTMVGIVCPVESCQHENPEGADVCEKCGADLGPIKEAPKEVETQGRTAKPYGIEIVGGDFAEIIPKNSLYPTDGTYVEEFHTVVPDQRIIKIPVYEGFAKKAADNAFMGNIWFSDLPPGLPENTPIEVSMDLDSDMVFTIGCRIRGTDWVRKVTLQHDGWENQAMDNAMSAHLEIQQGGITGHDAETVKEHVEKIKEAVEKGNRETAKKHMEEIRKIKDNSEREARKADMDQDWREELERRMEMGKSAVDRVRPILPDDDKGLKAFDDWWERSKKALENNDEAEGCRLKEKGFDITTGVPVAGDIMVSLILVNIPSLDPGIATKLEQTRHELLAAIDSRNVNQIHEVLPSFRNSLAEAMKALESSEGKPIDLHDGKLGR